MPLNMTGCTSYGTHVSLSDGATHLQSVRGRSQVCNRKRMHVVGLMTYLSCCCYEHHLCCRLNGLSEHSPAHVRGIHVAMPVQDIVGNGLCVSSMSTGHGHCVSRQKDVGQILLDDHP